MRVPAAEEGVDGSAGISGGIKVPPIYRSAMSATQRAQCLGLNVIDTVFVNLRQPPNMAEIDESGLHEFGRNGETVYYAKSGSVRERQVSPQFLCWARMGAMFDENLKTDRGSFQDCELTSFARRNYWDHEKNQPVMYNVNDDHHVKKHWRQIWNRFRAFSSEVWPSKYDNTPGLAYAGLARFVSKKTWFFSFFWCFSGFFGYCLWRLAG